MNYGENVWKTVQSGSQKNSLDRKPEYRKLEMPIVLIQVTGVLEDIHVENGEGEMIQLLKDLVAYDKLS